MNARSELVSPLNGAGGGVCERTCRFQTASPGLSVPARSPTRGSGTGSPGDMLLIDGMLLERGEPVVVAQAAATKTAAPSDNDVRVATTGCERGRRSRCTDSMSVSSGGRSGARVGVRYDYWVSTPRVTEMSSFSMRAISVV